MAGFFKSIFSGGWNTSKNFRYFGLLDQFDGKTSFDTFATYKQKFNLVFTSPAVLKVFALQCDMFSLGKFYVYDNGNPVDKDPFLELIKKPNPFQPKSRFLWDFMFWKMLGNAYIYVDSGVVDKANGNKIYLLDPYKITWPDEIQKAKDKIFLSESELKKLDDVMITYTYSDGTTFKFKFKKLISIGDLSNGLGNWYASSSRIDALYKIICNSEAALDSNNINIRYTGKFMVSSAKQDVNTFPMGDDEKKDIEEKVDSDKTVHAIKSVIDLKRFVEDAGALKLDDSFLSAYFLIGSMYGIPRDVLEAYNSATYENQEKARGAHVSYCLQPTGELLCNAFDEHFGYDTKETVLDWEHLPFMQVFAKDRANIENKKADSLAKLLDLDVPLDEINKFLDTDFSMANKKPTPQPMNNGQANNGSNSGAEGDQNEENQ